MSIQYINIYRDPPLILGIIAILIGFAHGGESFSSCNTPDGENPQRYCRAILNFVGAALICFGILGKLHPEVESDACAPTSPTIT